MKMKGVATSITMKIFAPIIIVILLAGGWFFYNKNTDSSVSEISPQEVTMTENVDEDAHNHDDHGHDDVLEDTLIGEEGTVTVLPVDPLLGVRSVGNPDAPIKIQEFFSLTCNHCAAFHTGPYQELKAKYIDTGIINFTYQEFPLNGPALYGSMIARCLPEERYTGFIDILLRNQESWAFSGNFKESLRQNAKLAGMSDEEFDACFENEDLQKVMAQNIAAAQDAWDISSTPSFVVNNGERIIRGAKSMKVFDALVAHYNTQEPEAEAEQVETQESEPTENQEQVQE